ncbi:MAG: iron ABC transporter permease [Flavobacteriales bacterium]|nr:MAG: iron ABC transporter permease [Flavobacteriales bacterium]
MSKRKTLVVALLAVLALLLCFGDLLVGTTTIPAGEVLGALFGSASSRQHELIVNGVRLPQALTALLAGGGLALCGLMMQTLFRNPLAGPSVLGVTSGAGLGVAVFMLAGGAVGGMFLEAGLVGAAFVGAMVVLLLIALADRRIGDGVTLLIVGLMIGYLCGALVSVLEVYGTSSAVKGFVLWGMGSFSGTTTNDLFWLGPLVVFCSVLALFQGKALNALLAGEEQAATFGVRVRRVRTWTIVLCGLLASTITAFCGPVAFIGLVTPHIARGILRTTDHLVLLPACLLIGSSLALMCDLLTRLPGVSGNLPLNAVTSLLGAPVVLWVLLQGRNFYRSA